MLTLLKWFVILNEAQGGIKWKSWKVVGRVEFLIRLQFQTDYNFITCEEHNATYTRVLVVDAVLLNLASFCPLL